MKPPQGLSEALKYARLGYRVFPVRWPSKAPAIKNWQNLASTDPLEIEEMWRGPRATACIGIACGPLLAIDLDEKDGKQGILEWKRWCHDNGVEVPPHHQITASGGAHSLYMLPPDEHLGISSGSLPHGVDIRGYGGLIVAYGDLPPISELQLAPEPLLQALRPSERTSRPRDSVTVRDPALGLHPYAQRAIGYELDRLDGCALRGDDYWDNTTFAVACNLIEFANSPWSGYDLDAAHEDFLKHAPVDNSGFPASRRDAKWESAIQKVSDSWREEPEAQYLTPQEVFDVWVEETEHKIFDASPILKHIRQAAHSRMLGSGAVLINVLGRVLAEVPPGVVLPPTIGSKASLNLGFALVGQSGDGKSATYSCGEELLGIPQSHIETGLGSGEGLIEKFLEERSIPDPRDPTKTVRVKALVDPPTRIFNVDEVAHLDRASARDGATIMAILRTALTGGALKSANATMERTRSVEKNSYRLVVFIGVQPALSGVLLNDADAGTPQRLLWISTVDRTVPRESPEWPGSLDWAGSVIHLRDYVVDYPDHVKELLKQQRFDRVHGRGDPLESHLMLTRLKVAAALAFLHDEIDINDKWWTISGHLMHWSKKEQDRCRAVLNEATAGAAKSRGRAHAVEEEAADQARMDTLKKRIMNLLGAHADLTWGQLQARCTPRQTEILESVVQELVVAGTVEVTVGEYQGRPNRRIRRMTST